MDIVKLPTEKAHEPSEEARQPVMCVSSNTMSSQETGEPKKRHATFADTTMTTEKELSQNSSAYKEALSQPVPGVSHRQRLAWLQRRRGPGLWVQCDACNAWRHLPHAVDSYQLPPKWYCSMNPDKSIADCSAAETPLRISDEEDLIHSEYSAGSLVWARLAGWPWWPAMVDDDPDTEQFYWLDGFSDIPTHYNVVFFDVTGPTRAWISPENLRPYTPNKKKFRQLLNTKQYKKRLQKAIQDADKVENLPIVDRLANFSFISTYKGPIVSPKKVTKRELEMYQNKLKRKFNVDFPIEAASDSEDESIQTLREINKKKNVILIGTPKRKITKQSAASDKKNVNTTVKKPVHEKLATRENPKDLEENNLNKGNCEPNLTDKDGNKEPKSNNNDMKTPKKSSSVIKQMLSFAGQETDETREESFKPPNSMITEIGSTQTFNVGSLINGIDNDSSKTYLPEEDESDPVVITQDFQIRAETPSSDDFDF